MAMLSDMTIQTRLIHYDKEVLDLAISESLGGVFLDPAGKAVMFNQGQTLAHPLPPAGSLLGNGVPLWSSGNQLMSLEIDATQGFPWRFLACYLPYAPNIIPLGVNSTVADITWRCIPYDFLYVAPGTPTAAPVIQEIQSSGVVLWDYELNTN